MSRLLPFSFPLFYSSALLHLFPVKGSSATGSSTSRWKGRICCEEEKREKEKARESSLDFFLSFSTVERANELRKREKKLVNEETRRGLKKTRDRFFGEKGGRFLL
jgi:hypothetical protein